MSSNLIFALVSLFLLLGCATPWPPLIVSSDYYLSDQFDETINGELLIVNVIDSRESRKIELKNIKGYSKVFRNRIHKLLINDKHFKVKQITADTASCKSVSEMKDLSCLPDNSLMWHKTDLVLFISIDAYTPPKLFKIASKAKLSGGLYSRSLNDFIWRDTLNDDSGDRDSIIFDTFFSDLDHTKYMFYSDEKIYLDCAISHIYSLLFDFPRYLENNEYEKQIAETDRVLR